MINTKEYEIQENIVAPSIYGNEKRIFTNKGIEISQDIKNEFEVFLQKNIKFIGLQKTTFFRIDAYFDNNCLNILDINGSFVDGRGNALNLTRAINKQIDTVLIKKFPNNFYLQEEIYRPEFDLFINELQLNGIQASETKEIDERYKTYMYGTEKRKANLYPYDGLRTDNKMNLALFSKSWDSKYIKIPTFILPSESSYEDIPKDSVLKITGKQDIGSGWKVIIGKPKKGKMASGLWEENKLVAQQIVNPYTDEQGLKNQAIIMTIDNAPLVGYVQKSTKNIITDNSIQGPLTFK